MCRSLGMGSFFGESILDDSPRENTIVTREPCQLLRVEQRDFRALWQVIQVISIKSFISTYFFSIT